MATEPGRTTQEGMEHEGEGLTGGPGVFATRSQARGAGAGVTMGVFAGALLGLVAGIVIFQGRAVPIIITVVAFATGGATFGGLVGGIVRSRDVSERETPDAPGHEYEGPVTKPGQ